MTKQEYTLTYNQNGSHGEIHIGAITEFRGPYEEKGKWHNDYYVGDRLIKVGAETQEESKGKIMKIQKYWKKQNKLKRKSMFGFINETI